MHRTAQCSEGFAGAGQGDEPAPWAEGQMLKIVHNGMSIDFLRAAIVYNAYLEYLSVATEREITKMHTQCSGILLG
jgi:hypothetical protein